MRQHRALAERLRAEHYGQALVMPRTWKSALAPFLAGIPERTGFVGEARFGLLNDLRFGERKLPRMIDRCGALALPKGATPARRLAAARTRRAGGRDARPGAQAAGSPTTAGRWSRFAPGAVGPSKRWPAAYYAELARQLDRRGHRGLGAGRPGRERRSPPRSSRAGRPTSRDLTGPTCATPSWR